MPERLTQQQLADDYSVSLSTLKRALRSGVDVHNKQAFVDWVYSNKKRPPGWENGVPWEQGEEQAEAIALSPELHELAEQVRNAPNYDVARTCKTKIDALMQVAKIAVLEGSYIHVDEVVDAFHRVGSAVSAAHKQAQADLPAMCEGLPAAQTKIKIRDYMLQIDEMLADESSKFHKK